MKIALWDLNGDKVQEKALALRAAGVDAKGWGVDVTDFDAVRREALSVERELGRLFFSTTTRACTPRAIFLKPAILRYAVKWR